MTVPTGNGEQRGPESAPGPGSPLPSRPDRARANNARNSNFLGNADPAPQGGLGTEDLECAPYGIGTASQHPADTIAPPPDLMSMGDPGETFGGS